MGHCCRAYCGVNLDIPLGMVSKFFINSAFIYFSLVFLPVCTSFWRCARLQLLISELTLVWSKVRNTANYSGKTKLKYGKTANLSPV